MNKNQRMSKQAYVLPEMRVIFMQSEPVMAVSGNAGTLGQGGTYGDARENLFYDEEMESQQFNWEK